MLSSPASLKNQSVASQGSSRTATALATVVLSLIGVAIVSGCGSFQADPASLESPGSPGRADARPPGSPVDSPVPGATPGDFTGSVAGGNFNGVQVVSIDWQKKEITFRLPMLANPILDGASLEIPVTQIPGAFIGLESLPGGGSALVVRMPLERYLKGINSAPPSRLPNGDPLPGVPDGELPSFAVDLNRGNIKATLYLAPTVVGIFVNSSFDPFVRLTFPIRNEARRVLGYFSTIPKKASHDGGFFLSVVLPDDMARLLDQLR